MVYTDGYGIQIQREEIKKGTRTAQVFNVLVRKKQKRRGSGEKLEEKDGDDSIETHTCICVG
jgi:hypothetical protein